MATTTTGLVDTTFVVNASGQAAGGIWPQFRLLLDGVNLGEATVGSTSAGRYTFKAQVAPDQAHKVQIVYFNDGYVNGQDRNLLVKSLEVNGKPVASTSALVSYDRGASDGKDVIPGQEGMWWDGSLDFALTKDYFPVPTPTAPAGNTNVVLNLQGNPAGGTNAHFNLLIDGKKVGEGVAGTTAKDYAFSINATADQAHKVQIQYDNDGYVNGQDRNLLVNKITINGKSVLPTDSNVTYDKGALDGKDVVKGQSGLWWNGTLVVDADKSYFPGSTTPTTPPAPTPTKPTLTVSDVSVTEPTGKTTGIAPGFLHTDGGQIMDSSGKAVKLTGVNWFGAEGYAFAPQGLWMDSYQSHMNKMQELGFNVIRLPYSDAMLDAGRKPTGIDYSKNPDLAGKTSLEVFDKIIEYADKIGMKIILDHHRSGDGASANENGLWYTSQYPESKMIENWKMLATRYKGNDAVIGADLHNEPHNPATWGDGGPNDWARAAERIGNAIQSVNKDWLLIVEGIETYQNQWYWWGGNLLGEKNYEVKFNTPDKLVYSVHDYGPSLYMMDWFKAGNFPNNMPAKWDQMWGHFIQNDETPILVGEFGSRMETAIDKAWMPKLVQYMNGDWNGDGKIDLAAGDQGASWTYWAWSPGSGDTGGIMNDSWQVDYNKYNAIKSGLYSSTAASPVTTDAVFTVKLSQAYSQAVTVDYATADGTAKAGSDYVAASGKLTFAAGETTKTVAVKVLSDDVTEGVENFSLKLSNPTQATIADGTGVGTINPPGTAQALSADLLAHSLSQETAAVQSAGSQPAFDPSSVDFSQMATVDAVNLLLEHQAA
ncbi:cellulase family glycosylhydrolase [Azospirillum isscasi]|uniref:cellulase n=1 Tax=Azospirillum isscasi TaxID=3053926 RepID=A0ABU0WDJ3_9PROT|nr:carbohydrate-binding domain-containing protein [Azospirillum isscasi]MDQ2102261.1 carbohydrate-binding domain-containing protein [Azospirillum isscasi]